MSKQYILGLDPAQLKDWSALAVVRREWDGIKNVNMYQLEALDRKQQLPYPEIVDWTIRTFQKIEFQKSSTAGLGEPELLLDATGVGRALWDMFRNKGVYPTGVSITSGNGLTTADGVYHLGKARLIGRFLGVLDSGRLLVNPGLPAWPLLERELVNYRAKISASGNAQFEAKQGETDDLLFALALCVFWGEEARQF